jgi:hypothetical protein
MNKIQLLQVKILAYFLSYHYRYPTLLKLIFAFLTFLSFSFLFNPEIGFILSFGIWVHEYGHVLALEILKIRVIAVYLVPFFGGITAFDRLGVKNYLRKYFISIMGPVTGALFGGLFLIQYLIFHVNWLGCAAILTIGINLLNLTPISPFDGGSIYDSIISSFPNNIKRFCYGIISGLFLSLGIYFIKTIPVISFILISGSIYQFISRVNKNPELELEPIVKYDQILLCVITYLLVIMGMLAMLVPLLNVNIVELLK